MKEKKLQYDENDVVYGMIYLLLINANLIKYNKYHHDMLQTYFKNVQMHVYIYKSFIYFFKHE